MDEGTVPRPFYNQASVEVFDELCGKLKETEGVCIVGAGLSKPGGFPDWTGLYERLRERVAGACGSSTEMPNLGDQNYANMELPDLFGFGWDYLGGDAALEFMQDIFCGPINGLPEAYAAIGSCESFGVRATFNYDEYFSELATLCGGGLASFPSFEPRYARNVYLHGRARFASKSSDLVVTSSDYSHAYQALDAILPIVLQLHLQGKLAVVIGSSLTDRMFLYQLGRLARIGRSTRASGAEQVSILDVYAFLAASDIRQPERESVVRFQSRRMEQVPVKPIWYLAEDKKHTGLLRVIDQLRERTRRIPMTESGSPDVVLLANEARRLAALTEPSSRDRERARSLLARTSTLRNFFAAKPSAAWFEWLKDYGYLDPPSATLHKHAWRSDIWPAAEYLVSLAGDRPDQVAEFLSDLRTNNWIALNEIGRILGKLSLDQSMQFAEALAAWLSTEPARFSVLASEATSVAERAVKTGEVAPSTWLPFIIVLFEHYYSQEISGAATHDHEAREFGERVLALAAKQSPAEIAELTLSTLATWLESEWEQPGKDRSAGLRPAIEEHRQNRWMAGLLDRLVAAGRGSLSALRGSPSYDQRLADLYGSDWPTLRRLALYEASWFAPGLVAITSELATKLGSDLYDPRMYHELSMLLAAPPSEVSPKLVGAFQEALAAGPLDRTVDVQLHNAWKEGWLAVVSETLLTREQRADEGLALARAESAATGDRRFFLSYISEVYSPAPPISREEFD